MNDFTREWIAKREQLEEVLSAHDALVDSCGDLTAAVAVGQLRVSDLLAEARADARTSLPAALAALKAVLAIEPMPNHLDMQPRDRDYADGHNDALRLVADTMSAALRGES